MSTSTYIIDSALVLLILLQIRERTLAGRELIRPVIVLAVAVAIYLNGVPTQGNDLLLVGVLTLIGGIIGVGSGVTVIMRRRADGSTGFRAGWASGLLWVLGMGSRFAFAWWASHTGAQSVGSFSAAHHITSGDAWTAALLAMAVGEVMARTVVMAARWKGTSPLALAPAKA